MENPTRESLLLLSYLILSCSMLKFELGSALPPKHGGAWCHAAAVPAAAPLLAARGLGPVPRLCIRPARQPVHPASGGACTGGGRGRLRRLCRSRRGAVQDLGGRRRAPPQPPTKCHRSRSLRPATAASQCALSSGAARPECVLAQPEPAGLGSGSQASELWHHQGGPLTVVATRCRRVPVQLRMDEGALRQVV